MPNNLDINLLLVGTGQMAIDYSKILEEIKVNYSAVGRSIEKTNMFSDKTGKSAISGGLELFLRTNSKLFSHAVVAVTVDQLAATTKMLVGSGIKKILLEKPGGLTIAEIEDLAEYVQSESAHVFIGYNRRFYSSVIEANRIIVTDGGVTSFNFEFTEWSHIIEKIDKPKIIKENWFLANSTHVIDLAFYLGSRPIELVTFTSGSLTWHPKASIFSGAGKAENGSLFSYQANWEAPGRWGVEILTKKHRLILRPMEKLHMQEIGSIEIKEVTLEDDADLNFKPGLFLQTSEFIKGEFTNLLPLSEHIHNCKFYKKILN